MFQNFFPEQDSNSGWVISRLKGYNASKFEYISFWVKGENGGEKFGIKMKDIDGGVIIEYWNMWARKMLLRIGKELLFL